MTGAKPTLGTFNPFRYRGAYGYIYDPERDLYYLKNRYYSQQLNRFLSPDSVLGKVGGLFSHNLYAYCAGNPVMYVDPAFGDRNSFSIPLSSLDTCPLHFY